MGKRDENILDKKKVLYSAIALSLFFFSIICIDTYNAIEYNKKLDSQIFIMQKDSISADQFIDEIRYMSIYQDLVDGVSKEGIILKLKYFSGNN